jgi:hypothetical protein
VAFSADAFAELGIDPSLAPTVDLAWKNCSRTW